MASATNVNATAVNTIGWLSEAADSIIVPVYQRQYRWGIGGCEQLLADVRGVADSGDGQTHFIGSILSSMNDADAAASELILIDGQQRITTLMLLIAALQHSVREHDPELAANLHRVLVNPATGRTKLRPHRAWADAFERVVLDSGAAGAPRESRFDDNYAFFRSQVHPEEAAQIWRGLQKLEHVAITLGPEANAQQTFESLNSTGAPLRDHELIHNYVLMGLTHAEQREIEDEFWLPIESNTGEAIGTFFRHYLVLSTGREVSAAGEHGVYNAFRRMFPRLDASSLRIHANHWREYSDIYRVLLDPAQEPDPEISRQLRYVSTFGRGMYPLIMRAYREYSTGSRTKSSLIGTIELVQAMLLRRAIVGLPTERLVARLCRADERGTEDFEYAVARITPSDERVRAVVKYTDLPHPAYVLGRLEEVEPDLQLDIEHITPLSPSDDWTGDGLRVWAEYTEDEQNSHRALTHTLGNLTLLEPELTMRTLTESFPAKTRVYARSRVPGTRALADTTTWNTAALSARTIELSDRLVQVWRRPAVTEIDDDGLTPILDAVKRRGWPHGWEREFEYVEYRGEHWEVYDVKSLFNRVFRRGWTDAQADTLAYVTEHGGPIYSAKSWNGVWDELDATHFLYMGWDANYMMTAIQGLLEASGIAAEVFVKYSYSAANM